MFNLKIILKYMFYCHRMPERSFFFRGRQFPICARCTGILIGYIIGILYIIFYNKLGYTFELILMVPLLIDGIGQYKGYFVSTNIRRLITGILGGISFICLSRMVIVFWLQCLQWAQDYILSLLR
ncbi:DUF2085 domain-containing protein [Clostridium sp. C2-6-12]|uniref:DUF2085 domain-containing protein n=1 Tax=Clostridium sp. C2-6-12 TaxID=2698832 RepID=UPI00136B1E2A